MCLLQVPQIHWRRGRSNEDVGKENRDFPSCASDDKNLRISRVSNMGHEQSAGAASPNCRGKALHDVTTAWGHKLHDIDPSIEPYHNRGRRSINTTEVKEEVESRIEGSCGTRASHMTPVRQNVALQFHEAAQKPFIMPPEVCKRLTKRMYKNSGKSGVFDDTASTIEPFRAADISGLKVSAYNSNAVASHLRMANSAKKQQSKTMSEIAKDNKSLDLPQPPSDGVSASAGTAPASKISGTIHVTSSDTSRHVMDSASTISELVPPPPPPREYAESRHFPGSSSSQNVTDIAEIGLMRRARPAEHPRGHKIKYYSAIHSDLSQILNHEQQAGNGFGPNQNPFRKPRPITGKVGVGTEGFGAQNSAGVGKKATQNWACLANTERKFLETRNHPMLGRPRGAPEKIKSAKSSSINDTWRSEIQSMLSHGLGNERSDKFATPGKTRAPMKMVSNRRASIENPAAMKEFAGRPTNKTRDAALTRVPWFKSGSKA